MVCALGVWIKSFVQIPVSSFPKSNVIIMGESLTFSNATNVFIHCLSRNSYAAAIRSAGQVVSLAVISSKD